MIAPTRGRVVWFHPIGHDPLAAFKGSHGPDGLTAHVVHVWHDRMVNLAILDPNGHLHQRTSVPLMQEGDPNPGMSYCEWMPYQKGQAAKTEQLEAKLAPAS